MPDLVINAAAFNDVDGAESRRNEAYAVNACGPRNLAFETAELGIPIVHVSTDYVFDGRLKRPYHEQDETNPLSLYAASKLAGERAVRLLNPRHYVVRTAWLFWESGKGFLTSMCSNASRPELRVADDQIGSPTYVPHLADAIARLIETGAFGTYHMAGSGGASRWQLVTEAFRLLGISTPVRPVSHTEFPAAANRPTYSVLTTVQRTEYHASSMAGRRSRVCAPLCQESPRSESPRLMGSSRASERPHERHFAPGSYRTVERSNSNRLPRQQVSGRIAHFHLARSAKAAQREFRNSRRLDKST